jgi:putative transposase
LATLSPSTVWDILRNHGIDPLPCRARLSWRESLRQQAGSIVERDFFTVDTIWLRRFYVFLLHRARQPARAHRGHHRPPNDAWVRQQACTILTTCAKTAGVGAS